jgi:hypothetical protein
MSEQPTPELRAVAERLFEAARAERPRVALGRRLDRLTPRREAPQKSGLLGAATRWRTGRRGASVLALGAAAAALIVVGPKLVQSWGDDEPIRISAEHGAAPRAAPSGPTVDVPPRPEREEAASEALPHAAEQPSAGTPRPPAAQRSRGLDRRRSTRISSPLSHASAVDLPAPAVGDPRRDAPETSAPAPPPSSLRAELEWLENARAELRAGHAQRAPDLLERPGHSRRKAGSAPKRLATQRAPAAP